MSEGEKTTVSQEEYAKAVERAQRFEAQLVDMEKRIEPFKGVDLERLKAHSEELELLKKEKATKSPEDLDAWKKAERETVSKELRAELQKELDDLRTQKETLSSRVTELEITDVAMNEVGPLFNDDTHPVIKDIIRKRVAKDAEGKFVIKNERGEPAYSAADPNKPLTLLGLAEEIAKKYPSFAKPEVVAGARNGNGEQRGGVVGDGVMAYARATPEQRAARWTPKERQDFAQQLLNQIKV